jgi:hypothetical protein
MRRADCSPSLDQIQMLDAPLAQRIAPAEAEVRIWTDALRSLTHVGSDYTEAMVRVITALLVLVLDPLAVLLTLAAARRKCTFSAVVVSIRAPAGS